MNAPSAPPGPDATALALSILDWWALAGMDRAVGEAPVDWLAPPPEPAPLDAPIPAPLLLDAQIPAPGIAEPASEPRAMPGTIDGFVDWLANDPDQPEAAIGRDRILPTLFARPRMLIVTDMPTVEDMGARALFSSADGELLGAMLRALGTTRQGVAVASLLMARPAGGVIDANVARTAAARLARLIDIVEPAHVVGMGDATNRALVAAGIGGRSDDPPPVNHRERSIGRVVGLPAPFVLLKHPARKAAAWAELRHIAAT